MNPPYSDIHSLSSGELDPQYNPTFGTLGGSSKEPVSYEAYKLTKLDPRSWARVRRNPIHLSQKELRAEVSNRNTRGSSAFKQYTKLAKLMQGQVDRLIQDRNKEEIDLNVKYELAALKTEHKNIGKHEIETASIQIILRRRLHPQMTQDGPKHLNLPGEIIDLHDRPMPQPPVMAPGGGRTHQKYEPYPPHEQGPWIPGPFPGSQIVDGRSPVHNVIHDTHFPPPHTPVIQCMHPPPAHGSPPEAPMPPQRQDVKADKKGDKKDDKKDGKKDDKKDDKKEHDKDRPRTKIIEFHHIHKPKANKRVDKWFKDLPVNSGSESDYDSFSENTTPTSVSGYSNDHKSKHHRHRSPHRSDVYREPTREHRRKSPMPSPSSRRPISHHEDHRETVPARTRPLPSSRRTTGYIAERSGHHLHTGTYEDDRSYENERRSEVNTNRPRTIEEDRHYEHDRYSEPRIGRTRTFEDDRLYENDKRYEIPISRPRRVDTDIYLEDSLRWRDRERERALEDYIVRDGRREYVR